MSTLLRKNTARLSHAVNGENFLKNPLLSYLVSIANILLALASKGIVQYKDLHTQRWSQLFRQPGGKIKLQSSIYQAACNTSIFFW